MLARLLWLLNARHDRTTVLIGEKAGTEARDNGFAYFRHLATKKHANIYYVYQPGNRDLHRLNQYTEDIVRKNSFRHIQLFLRARLLIFNDGPDDVSPSVPGALRASNTPILYLQHGITKYKKLYFSPSHYGSKILGFVVSTDSEREIITDRVTSNRIANLLSRMRNDLWSFGYPISRIPGRSDIRNMADALRSELSRPMLPDDRKEKLEHLLKKLLAALPHVGLPESRVIQSGLVRHKRLISLNDSTAASSQSVRRLLIFLTWRDYWPRTGTRGELLQSGYIAAIEQITGSPEFKSYIERHALAVSVYLHDKINAYAGIVTDAFNQDIEIINGRDLQEVIIECKLLITDYSSVAFEFALLGKPVIFYQFDVEDYRTSRGWYVRNEEDWVGFRATTTLCLRAILTQLDSETAQARLARIQQALLAEYPNLGRATDLIDPLLNRRITRVAFLCNNIYGVGGTVRSVTNLANTLINLGAAVTVISIRRTSEVPVLGLSPAVRVIPILDVRRTHIHTPNGRGGMRSILFECPSLLFHRQEELYAGFSLLTDLRLVWLLRALDDDVIVTTLPSASRLVRLLKRRSTRLIIQEHKFYSAHPSSIQRFIRREYSKADAVLTLTEADKREYESLGANNIRTLCNGTEDGSSEKRFGKRRNCVVSLGRLDTQKQVDLLIKAFASISQYYPDWTLEIYGEGAERKKLQKLIITLGFAAKIFLKGNTNDSKGVLSQASICAVSSSYEGFGMVYIEAFSVGTPVVTFDIDRGPKEIMTHGQEGLKAECFDIEDYSHQMGQLMANRELRYKLGSNAYETFKSRFDINVIAQKALKIIEGVCESKGIRDE